MIAKLKGFYFNLFFPVLISLPLQALQELNSVLQNAAKDETKAVVLCGSGSMFCSGLDLRLMATQSYDERKKTAKALSDAVR